MANHSRWDHVKNEQAGLGAETHATVEQGVALGQLISDLRTQPGSRGHEVRRGTKGAWG